MSSVSFTVEQLKAVNNSGKNILVSASAGSGKTTVLIERIIKKIKNSNWNIDEMLIVTFTEAAANEMKQKLRGKLNKELLKCNNSHIRMQLAKLANAQISTFHSFCNSIIKKFFYLIDVDAKYKISEDIEIFLIAEETLEQLFNDLYENKDEQFMLLVNRFTNTTHDETLKELVKDLYFKLRTFPFKEKYINNIINNYEVGDKLNSWILYPNLIKNTKMLISEAENYFKKAYNLALNYNHNYINQYNDDMEVIDTIKKIVENDFDVTYDYLRNVSFKTFNSKCSSEVDELIKQTIKDFRDKGKEIISKDLVKKYFSFKEKSQVKFINENKLILQALLYLVNLFETRFSENKRNKNLVDFSDLEEMALQILSYNDFNNEAISYYKNQFKEILIDEFQDTNTMQETIINSISNKKNIFMVGDVKQSIYRFRSAEPEIFQNKYKKYENENIDGELINLNLNYRSREEIIDFINYLFFQLMDEYIGEITYDEKASLLFGQNEYKSYEINDTLVSVHILEKEKINELQDRSYDKTEIEANYIAKKIRQLIDGNAEVFDKDIKGLRKVTYKDIVILSRTKNEQEIYNDIFKKYNIPFLSQDMSGYFNSIEVMTITSVLKIIDNPLQDIPLVAILRSPIFNINEKELIAIKSCSKKNYYYDKILDYLKVGQDEKLQNKLKYFIEMLSLWRESVKNEPLSDLIYSIYHDTNYYDFVLGQFGGKQRQANLDLLYDRAKTYENLTSNSLFRFINLINFLNEKDKDLSQARTVSENEDLVRFMTIHKSKGLEFPIVFITNLSKKYNTEDEKNTLLFDKDLGISFSYMDIENRVKYDTIYQSITKDKLHKQMLAEEMRLLYVAFTRAKERLFLIGTVNDFDKEANKLTQIASFDELVLPIDERQVTNYFSLILLALTRHTKFTKLLKCEENLNFNQCFKKEPDCDIYVVNQMDFSYINNDKIDSLDEDYINYKQIFDKKLNYQYPHLDKTNHFAKQTIADIKRANSFSDYNYNNNSIMLKIPKFIDLNKANATLRGTSFHIFMQHINYQKEYNIDNLMELKNNLIVKEILSETQAGLVDLKKVLNYLNSDIVSKIKKAKKINKELPFTTLVNSNKVYNDLDDVLILIQGVTDLFVIFDSEAYLIDYKSDRINDTQEDIDKIKKQYQIQIDVYKDAMKNVYPNLDIKAYLYLFEINKFINM